MNCSTLSERIPDLALEATIVDTALRAHLDSCRGCRDALASRRALLAAIDRVLIEELRESPSPMVAARVSERIEKEAAPRRTAWFGWIPAAAGMALLTLVALCVWDHLPSRLEEGARRTASLQAPVRTEPGQADPASTELARTEPPRPTSGPGSTVTSARIEARRARGRSSRLSGASLTASHTRALPEVLVPSGEMTAALQWSEAAARHPLVVPASETGEQAVKDKMKPLIIEEIEIAPLVLLPLEDGAQQPVAPVAL